MCSSDLHVGLLVSVIPWYNKATEQESAPKKENKPSNYVGIIGSPIGQLSPQDKRKLKASGTNLDAFPFNGPIAVTITGTGAHERQGFGYYDRGGVTHRYNMIDDNGNRYVTFSSADWGVDKGDQVSITRALVKNHQEYKDVKQTVLTRVAVQDARFASNEAVDFKTYYASV